MVEYCESSRVHRKHIKTEGTLGNVKFGLLILITIGMLGCH